MRILVIEDDALLGDAIQAGLKQSGYAVDWMKDGVSADQALGTEPYAAVVLDLGLPRMSGLEVLRRLRSRNAPQHNKQVPVLILTARDSWQEKVAGLDAGADDYVTKPFRFEEVLARVQALLRRSGGWSQPLLKSGAVELDTRSQEVRVAGTAIELTAFEYRLLEYLMLRAGQVVSKAELTDKLYEQDFERDSNTIEVFIGRLRRKLDPDGDRLPIETLRGRGYRINRD